MTGAPAHAVTRARADPAPSLPSRLVSLYVGLIAFGASMALLVESRLGAMPWDVLHQGLSLRAGWSFGVVTMVVGAAVLLLWIPLRERPGLGTVSNVIVIGLAVDAALYVLPTPDPIWIRWTFLVVGIVLNAAATVAYIGARFGPGPRDGLMTGLVRRTGGPVGLIKGSIEVSVVVAGWLLGGTVGIGTIAFALAVGPLVQWFMQRSTRWSLQRPE